MNLSIVLMFVLLFLLSTGFFYVLLGLFANSRFSLRDSPALHPGPWVSSNLSSLGERLELWLSPIAADSLQDKNWQTSAIRLKMIQAGLRGRYAVAYYLGAKFALALLFPLLAYSIKIFAVPHLSGAMLLGLLAASALVGFLIPNLIVHWFQEDRQRQLRNQFPDGLDLIRICIEAGLGLDAAILRVGEEFKKVCPPLHQEFHLISLELRAGSSRNEALKNFAARTGLPEIAAFASILNQSDRFGTGVAKAIQIHADDVRHNRKLRAEELAAKISTKLLFPLIFCIFPALLLVLLGPAAISILQNLKGVTMN